MNVIVSSSVILSSVGADDGKPSLYMIDPSGVYWVSDFLLCFVCVSRNETMYTFASPHGESLNTAKI